MPICCGIDEVVDERDDEHLERRRASMTKVEDDLYRDTEKLQ